MALLSILGFQLLLVLPWLADGSQNCAESLGSTYGYFLRGHVFKSFKSEGILHCYNACNANPACQSLNLNLADNSCEFNSELKRSRLESFEAQEMYVYSENPNRGEQISFCYFIFLSKRSEVVAETIDAFSIIPLFNVIDSSNSVKSIKAVHSGESCQRVHSLHMPV